jgi:N-acetylglucosamine kinase-like BadF-type ATPase
MKQDLYLGIDGGQSHTEAVIADREGHILGRGRGGPSNHAEQPGGRERLRRAITDSVGSALRAAGEFSIGSTIFAAAHCAMTGGADFKEEIIHSILRANQLEIGHDAPAALVGATAGEPGIVVIAGTGSVAYGENKNGKCLRVGGWGYLFGDEGGGFWVAMQGVRRAMLARDALSEPTMLAELALEYFGSADLQTLAMAVYREEITRDRFASFAAHVQRAATEGDRVARVIVAEAGSVLAKLAAIVARRLNFAPDEMRVAPVGGVFRGALVREAFVAVLNEELPEARVVAPKFNPAIGALLFAYRAAGRVKDASLLKNLNDHINARDSHEATSQREV